MIAPYQLGFSYLVNLIPTCNYSIYRMDAHSHHRKLIDSVPVDRPAYMHTFAMTQRWIILAEYPLRLSRLSLLFSGKPVIENYEWQPEQETRFLIIIELPRINYPRCNTRRYQFAYGVGSSRPGQFLDRLVKVDVQHRTAQRWHSPDCYASEPVFVAAL